MHAPDKESGEEVDTGRREASWHVEDDIKDFHQCGRFVGFAERLPASHQHVQDDACVCMHVPSMSGAPWHVGF